MAIASVAAAGSASDQGSTLPVLRPRLVLVGGVPGAGKTTVLDAVVTALPGAASVDPERIRRWLAALLPPSVPYRCYRALVHLCSTALVLALVLWGPTPTRRALVIHDPATRRRRRTLTGRLARSRGWDPVLMVVDVSRETALAGQRARRRVLAPRAFDRHWQRWWLERPRLLALSDQGRADGPWSAVHVVERDTAGRALVALLDRTGA